jgi:hypothetical protein
MAADLDAPDRVAPAARPEPRAHARRWPDVLAFASFVAAAFALTSALWADPARGVLNEQDQAFFEWMLAYGARVVTDGVNPFFSNQMNYPDGLNMMANTSVLALSLPLTPLTLTVGPHATFTIVLTAVMIVTASTWYLFLSRGLHLARSAAWVGALFCAFAPGMVAHANGHPNIVGQFLVPVIIWRVLALHRDGRWLRNGLLLALPIVVQAFVNLEILFMLAVALGLFTAVMAVLRPDLRRSWRPFLAGLAVAAGASLVVLAYPIWYHFTGPQTYHGLSDGVRQFGTDLAAYPAFARQSLAGDAATAQRLAQNASEENAFLGWPLLILLTVIVGALIRQARVVALAAVAVVLAAFSLGPRITIDGRATGLPSVWQQLNDLPVLNAIVPTRWALAVVPVVGLLLAIGLDAARRAPRRPVWFGALLAYGVALLPLIPTPLPTRELTPAPAFVTSGAWRDYTAGGRSIVFVPTPNAADPAPLRWAAQTGTELRFTHGYFLGPNPQTGKSAFQAPGRTTTAYLNQARRMKAGPVTPRLQALVRDDLRYWNAGAVVLLPDRYAGRYRAALTRLYGFEPREVGGVWVWDVRGL